MAVPTLQQTSAGAATATSGAALTESYPVTGLAAGDLFIAQVSIKDRVTTPTTPGPLTSQYAADDNGVNGRMWTYYRVSDGTESGTVDFGSPAITVVRQARIYRFRGTHPTAMFEGAAVATGNSATVPDTGVTTTGPGRLAINLVSHGGVANSIGPFTGETGGDWVEPVAEFFTALGADNLLQIQTADMAAAGTINGGSVVAAASAAFIVRGFALIPNPFPDVMTARTRT